MFVAHKRFAVLFFSVIPLCKLTNIIKVFSMKNNFPTSVNDDHNHAFLVHKLDKLFFYYRRVLTLL